MSIGRRAVRSFGFVTSGDFLAKVTAFIGGVAIARVLTPAEYKLKIFHSYICCS